MEAESYPQETTTPQVEAATMTNPSPTLRRRSLSGELSRLRKQLDVTAEQVDDHFGWTKGKTAWMERNKWQRPDPRDITDMLSYYGVEDEPRRNELLTWARQGREKGWWHPYRQMLSETYTTYIGLEHGASTLRVFELAVIPGILQTADYARALMTRRPGELSEAEIDRRVEIRLARQRILTRDDAARLRVVLDEAALTRPAGSPEVMEAQMRHLREMAGLPRVELQVIPFSKGTHAGTQGPFTILEFSDAADVPAVYTENVAGELFIEEPEEVAKFRLAFESLTAVADDPGDSLKIVERYEKPAKALS